MQGLRLLHVSANFVEPIRNAVSSGTRREIGSAVIGVRRGLGRKCLALTGHSSTTSTLIVGVKVDMSCAGTLPNSHGLLAGLVIATCLSLERITAVKKQNKIGMKIISKIGERGAGPLSRQLSSRTYALFFWRMSIPI